MDLYKEILIHVFANQPVEIWFPQLQDVDPVSVTNLASYRALSEIREIIRDERLDDPECFQKIEEIILALERAGLDTGFRHDFG